MQFEQGRQLFEQLVDDSRGGHVRWYHGQETITAVFRPRTRHALYDRLRHPEKRFSNQETISVGSRAGAEFDHVSKEDSAVLAVQRP
jgi:hypothetical protein